MPPLVSSADSALPSPVSRSRLCVYAYLDLVFLLLFRESIFERLEIISPLRETFQAEPFGAPGAGIVIHNALGELAFFRAVHSNPRQRHLSQAEVHQTATQWAHDVIMLLRHAGL